NEDSRLVALDTKDGEVRWETRLPKTGIGHSTPVVIEAGGRAQVVVLAAAVGVTAEGWPRCDQAVGRAPRSGGGGGTDARPGAGGGRGDPVGGGGGRGVRWTGRGRGR